MTQYPDLTRAPSRFSSRLREVMAERGVTLPYVAYATKISKTLLKRLLDEDIKKLPDAYTLIRLARALDVSVDHLLGLNFTGIEGDMAFAAEFIADAFDTSNFFYEEMFLSQVSGYFIYVCETLPELLKTPTILEAELGCRDTAAAYGNRMLTLRMAADKAVYNGIVLIDSSVMRQLMTATGRYAHISAAQRKQQIDIINDFLNRQTPTVTSAVVDYRVAGLSQMFLATPCRVVSRLGDGYVSTINLELFRHLRRIALQACHDAPSVAAFLDAEWQAPRSIIGS